MPIDFLVNTIVEVSVKLLEVTRLMGSAEQLADKTREGPSNHLHPSAAKL